MNRSITLISIIAALGGLLFGFDTAIISGTIPYISSYFALDGYRLGWAVSSILIGCASGAALAGKLADRLGRRYLLMLCAFLFAASGLGAGLCANLFSFIVFRLIGGLGVGAAAMISPMYIAETVPAHLRGRLVSLYQLAIVLGILLAYFSNYLFDGMGASNWRWMFASQVLPAVIFWLMLFAVPETPRWLIKAGKIQEAKSVLSRIGYTGDHDVHIAEMIVSFHSEKNRDTSFYALLNKNNRKFLWTSILIAVFQQITGINSVLYYAPVIFKQTGLDNASSMLQTIGIGVVNVLATFIAIGLVDRLGRKFFLVSGSLVMGISLVSIGLCFQYQYFDNYLVLIFTLLYVAAFGCTLGAVTWVYLSEIFPNRIRAVAMSAATLALWLADFAVTYTFPVMTEKLGTSVTLFCYAGCCLLAFLYLTGIPETKGKTLEEMEHLFNQRQSKHEQ